jgi:hypothetical protein
MANKIARQHHGPQERDYKINSTNLVVAQITKWLNGGPK